MDKRDLLKTLGSAFVAAPVAALTAKMTAPQSATQESVYDRVLRTGLIRCGYTPYSVGLKKDPLTGALSGIYFDIITEMARNLSLKAEYVEEVGWGEQIQGLAQGRYDMICSPVSLNSGRARAADFSIPLYYSPVYIWARSDDRRFDNNNEAIDKPSIKIATLDGEQTSVFARNFFPHAKQTSLPQSAPFSDLILQVTSGKADVVFAEPASVEEFLATHPGSLRRVETLTPLVVVPNIFLLKTGEYAFKQMIDNGLREMFNTGRVNQIIDRYEAKPGLYLREQDRR